MEWNKVMEFSKMALELCNLAEQIFAHFSTPVFKKISNANYTFFPAVSMDCHELDHDSSWQKTVSL